MEAFDNAYPTIERVRRTLQFADTSVISGDSFRRASAATIKSSAYVSMGAILERCIVEFSYGIREAVVATSAPDEILHSALAALACSGQFSAARDSSRSALKERVDLLIGTPATVKDWSTTATFHDGKTVDAETFEAIWLVLRLEGDPFPSPATRFTLTQLKQRRNRICHGEATFEDEGRRVTVSDALKDLLRIQNQIEHLDIVCDKWIRTLGWRA